MADGRAAAPPAVGLSLGFSAETLEDLGPALDEAEALGVDAVEVFAPAFGLVLGAQVSDRMLTSVARVCAGRAPRVTLHGPLSADLGEPSCHALQRDVAAAMLECAEALGAELYVQHAAIATPDRAEAAMAREREALAALAETAAAARCVIGLETMWARPGEWTASGGEIAATVRAVDSPWVGATLDFSHAWLNARARGLDPMTEIAAAAAVARHLHVHDSFGQPARFRPWSRGDAMAFGFDDLHLPPGFGSLPWSAFAALTYGAVGVVNLELEKRWRTQIPAAVAFARDWARAAFPASDGRRAAATR